MNSFTMLVEVKYKTNKNETFLYVLVCWCCGQFTQQNISQWNTSALNQDTTHWLSVNVFYLKKGQL